MVSKTDDSAERAFLRHTVATLAYRGGKAIRDVPEGFGGFTSGDTSLSGSVTRHSLTEEAKS